MDAVKRVLLQKSLFPNTKEKKKNCFQWPVWRDMRSHQHYEDFSVMWEYWYLTEADSRSGVLFCKIVLALLGKAVRDSSINLSERFYVDRCRKFAPYGPDVRQRHISRHQAPVSFSGKCFPESDLTSLNSLRQVPLSPSLLPKPLSICVFLITAILLHLTRISSSLMCSVFFLQISGIWWGRGWWECDNLRSGRSHLDAVQLILYKDRTEKCESVNC